MRRSDSPQNPEAGQSLVAVHRTVPTMRDNAVVSAGGAAAVGALALGAIGIGAWVIRTLALGAPQATRRLEMRHPEAPHAASGRSTPVVRYHYRFECLIQVGQDRS